MLRDRYAPVDLLALAPALAPAFEPVLARLDVLLDDDVLCPAVRADLARRYPRTRVIGRPPTSVEAILQMLTVRRLYGWSYAEIERLVGDSLMLRRFCRLGLGRAPDDTTLLRWANLIRPTTLDARLDHVVALARRLKVARGRKLRVDSAVVGPAIRHPTDSGLLTDAARMLGRVVRRAHPLVGGVLAGVRDAYRTRTMCPCDIGPSWLPTVGCGNRPPFGKLGWITRYSEDLRSWVAAVVSATAASPWCVVPPSETHASCRVGIVTKATLSNVGRCLKTSNDR